jgi:hypothetical protein
LPTELEEYLFDLRGFIIIENAIDPDLVSRLNDRLTELDFWGAWEWNGHLRKGGTQISQIFEGGAPFEELIDHPAWIDHARRFVGKTDGLFIDEAVAIVRGEGGSIRLHSGGHKRRIRTQYRYHDGEFRCGQINVMVPLTPFGPGDGATMLIPGSHKSNLLHPAFERPQEETMELSTVECAVEVYADPGDAIVFFDCTAHGSAARTNKGERRSVLYRYGPGWANNRNGYQPSSELLERLTPERRKTIQPRPPQVPPNV